MLPQSPNTLKVNQIDQLALELFERLDNHIIMGIPIGIGKPVLLVNALYRLAKKNANLKLDIHTGLTLSKPQLKTELERRLLGPFFERHFKDFIDLDYVHDLNKGKLPKNVNIIEFYFKPGERLYQPASQQQFFCSNYTHVARDMAHRGTNLFGQWVAERSSGNAHQYSLSSNPDVTLDLHRLMREQTNIDGKPRLAVAEVQNALPFMTHDAQIEADFFDYIIQVDRENGELFAAPHQSITPADHMIGFYASSLVKDAGTLQLGIGSLADAAVNALMVRQLQPKAYQTLVSSTKLHDRFPVTLSDGGTAALETGLYGNTELLVPGYFELKDANILKRQVYDDVAIQSLINQGLQTEPVTINWLDQLVAFGAIKETLNQTNLAYLQHWGILTNQVALTEGQLTINGNHYSANLKDSLTRTALEKFALGTQINNGRLIHAGFFVGTKEFYNRLHRMPTQERDQIKMTSVSFTNQLLGNEALKLAQRKHARFINATMKMTLLGAAVSDGLADGNVVSGVGGQYNFVAMAHDLPEARSILMMRSVRYKGKKVFSNIVFNYGHTTIPRHLRDIVITEYGIADLRGKTDEGIIDALLRVTDSRFQSQLIKQAKKAGKLAKSYKLPKSAKNNIPDSLNQHIAPIQDHFGQFPFGSELTEDELMIAAALKGIVRQLNRKWPIAISLLRRVPADKVQRNIKYLERMKLVNANTIKQRIYRKLLLSELN